jgi:hypothetical protein
VKTLDAVIAYQAVLKLIDDPQTKCVMFSYALAKNRRILEPIVNAYDDALVDATQIEIDALQQTEISPDFYPICPSKFPANLAFDMVDKLYPLIAGDE